MVGSSLSILSSITPSAFPSNSKSFDYSLSTPSPSSSRFRVRAFNSSQRNPRSLRPVSLYYIPTPFRFRKLKVCASQSVVDYGPADQFLEKNSIADFMRFKRGTTADGVDSYELQTSVVSYRKKFPYSLRQPFLQVDLVSIIHVADKEYFETLQKELESYDCVLYEMVASRECFESHRNSAKKLKSLPSRDFGITSFLQRQMGRLIMLDYQLDCLDYKAENWYHADLDLETFELLQQEKGESVFGFARDTLLRPTEEMIQSILISEHLIPWRSILIRASRLLPLLLVGLVFFAALCVELGCSVSEFPELEVLDFGAAVKFWAAQKLSSGAIHVIAADAEGSVIIGERNRAATEALRRALNEGHNKIAILYGSGHMPDLGRRLREDFNIVPSGVRWITAWSITNPNVSSTSLPFLKKMAEFSRWPLNRYNTLALILFSSVLALIYFWFWIRR